jgi:hypothetical protein
LYSQLTDAGIASGGSATGQISAYSPRFEIWPHPTTARGFQFSYRRRTVNFVNDDDAIPDSIDPELVLFRAKVHAYEWAETNKANEPSLQATNWFNLMVSAKAEYREQLRIHIKADRETFPNSRVFTRQGVGRYSPDYLQSHGDPVSDLEAFYGYGRMV